MHLYKGRKGSVADAALPPNARAGPQAPPRLASLAPAAPNKAPRPLLPPSSPPMLGRREECARYHPLVRRDRQSDLHLVQTLATSSAHGHADGRHASCRTDASTSSVSAFIPRAAVESERLGGGTESLTNTFFLS